MNGVGQVGPYAETNSFALWATAKVDDKPADDEANDKSDFK
jgi:hypothetical protein